MPHPAIARWRQTALVLAAGLTLLTLVYLVLGWARRSGTTEPPALDPGRVTLGLALAAALGGWAVLGRARDDVSRRVRHRHPERPLVLTTDDLPGEADQGDVAWSDPRTPRLWRSWWRPLMGPVTIAGAALVLIGLTTLMARMASADLTSRGVQTTGQVTATGWTFTGLGWSPWVRITHLDAGRTLSSTVHGVDPVGLPVGTQLTVVEDPEDPETVQAVDTPNVSAVGRWWRSLLVLTVAGSLLWLVVLVARWWSWRRRLRAVPWGAWEVSPVRAGRSTLLRLVPEASGDGPPVLARAAGPVEPGAIALAPGSAESVWQRRRVLLAGGASLVEARLPATPAEHARWSRSAASAADEGLEGSDLT